MGKTALIGKEDIETDFSSEIIEIDLPGGTRGLQGPIGPQGETGDTPQLHIGTVSDSDTAEASITGTKKDPVLNMGLPRGKSGVWVGEDAPDNEQYNVWVDPIGTPGTIPKKTSDLTNDSGFIDKDVNTLTNYELKTNTGATIDLSIDSSTYVMTLALKNSAGTTISTDSIDLPLETMVVGASYDNQTKEIVLTLKNGNTTRFSVADLVSGLVSSDYLITNYYNKSTVDTNIANVVTDSSSQSTTTAYSANYVNNAIKDIYSEDEVKTNKIFLGKPVYRSVIIRIVGANNTDHYEVINRFGISKCWINRGASFNNYATTSGQPVVETSSVGMDWYQSSNDNGFVYVAAATGELNIKNSSNYLRKFYVVLEYTKVTD